MLWLEMLWIIWFGSRLWAEFYTQPILTALKKTNLLVRTLALSRFGECQDRSSEACIFSHVSGQQVDLLGFRQRPPE